MPSTFHSSVDTILWKRTKMCLPSWFVKFTCKEKCNLHGHAIYFLTNCMLIHCQMWWLKVENCRTMLALMRCDQKVPRSNFLRRSGDSFLLLRVILQTSPLRHLEKFSVFLQSLGTLLALIWNYWHYSHRIYNCALNAWNLHFSTLFSLRSKKRLLGTKSGEFDGWCSMGIAG